MHCLVSPAPASALHSSPSYLPVIPVLKFHSETAGSSENCSVSLPAVSPASVSLLMVYSASGFLPVGHSASDSLPEDHSVSGSLPSRDAFRT